MQCNAMECNATECNGMHCIALHCILLHCIAVHSVICVYVAVALKTDLIIFRSRLEYNHLSLKPKVWTKKLIELKNMQWTSYDTFITRISFDTSASCCSWLRLSTASLSDELTLVSMSTVSRNLLLISPTIMWIWRWTKSYKHDNDGNNEDNKKLGYRWQKVRCRAFRDINLRKSDLETGVRGHWKSLEMSPCNTAHATSN